MSPPGNEKRPAERRSAIGPPAKLTTRHRSRGVFDPRRRARCPLDCEWCPFSTCVGLIIDDVLDLVDALVSPARAIVVARIDTPEALAESIAAAVGGAAIAVELLEAAARFLRGES